MRDGSGPVTRGSVSCQRRRRGPLQCRTKGSYSITKGCQGILDRSNSSKEVVCRQLVVRTGEAKKARGGEPSGERIPQRTTEDCQKAIMGQEVQGDEGTETFHRKAVTRTVNQPRTETKMWMENCSTRPDTMQG